MKPRLIENNKRAVYTCTTCGKTDVWSPDWAWYGSWRDWDNGKLRRFACSELCKQGMSALTTFRGGSDE